MGVGNGADHRFHRSAKFSCLAFMEYGNHDIHLGQVEHVMALATGNSIYAAEYLLQDPYKSDKSATASMHGICRILGNIGYPGIVMLVPPPEPLSLKLGSSIGRHVSADRFSGDATDRFRTTSMHLRCTDFTIRVAGAQGAVDGDVVIREALVQVFDGPKWVTDLDLLASLNHQSLRRIHDCNCSPNSTSSGNGIALQKAMGRLLRSVTQWDEVLLCQENLIGDEVGVVCTSGNWYARLAVAGLAALKNWQTIIFPEKPLCGKCMADLVTGQQEAGPRERARLYVL
ncbi:hypothetical protein ColTof3_08785 [Colletotrichum tofieldiae]|nr:hypothetical protein ColTof3_08785 [Colletotrichum tofieldiae]GKT93563.1 hypothetical protein Ct61P_11413 [Colletotrichum tofieldiae]